MSDQNPAGRSLTQWLDYQLTLHPESMELGLDRVNAVAQRLGLAPPKAICVVVAGTNGKGSSIALLEAIYRASGYRVGCYTSPHLHDYRERVRVNGEAAEAAEFCAAFAAIEQARATTTLTYFEFGTLAALLIFQGRALDVLLLEVGLGGRLDAVNIVNGDLALITQIDLDHCDWLGDNREDIGAEKAGIMRAGIPVVCADPDLPRSVVDHARQLSARLFRAGVEFDFCAEPAHPEWQLQLGKRTFDLPLPALPGWCQVQNAAAVIQAVELLQSPLPVAPEQIKSGLARVVLAGRFECHPGSPELIFDVAHNPQACSALADNLRERQPAGKRLAVVAMLADKDFSGCFEPLVGLVDQWYLASLDAPRGAHHEALQVALVSLGAQVPVKVFDSVKLAIQQAKAQSHPNDQLVVWGSFHTVAAAR